MAEEAILVTGATGRQGGIVARYLLPQLEKRQAIPLTKFRERVTTEASPQRLQPEAA